MPGKLLRGLRAVHPGHATRRHAALPWHHLRLRCSKSGRLTRQLTRRPARYGEHLLLRTRRHGLRLCARGTMPGRRGVLRIGEAGAEARRRVEGRLTLVVVRSLRLRWLP